MNLTLPGWLQKHLEAVLAALAFWVLLITRLPFLLNAHELNKDESLMLSMGARMTEAWIPWQSTLGGSSGPFTPGLLALLQLIGLPYDYITAHAAALLLLAATLWLGWRIARRMTDRFSALLGFLCLSAWLSVNICGDFIHFASELLPMFFITLGLYLLSTTKGTCEERPGKLIPACILLGLAPWTKLQAAPLALALCLWVAYSLLSNPSKAPWRRQLLLLALASFSALLPSFLFIAAARIGGSFEDFWNCYILANISYIKDQDGLLYVVDLLKLLYTPWGLGLFVFSCAAFCLAPEQFLRKDLRHQFILCGLFLSAACFAYIRPAHQLLHYQILLLVPVEITLALMISITRSALAELSRTLRIRLFTALLAVGVALPCTLCVLDNMEMIKATCSGKIALNRETKAATKAVARVIPAHDSVFVWGWMSAIYVSLQSAPSTRFGDFFFLVNESPARDFMQARCMQDLESSKPNWIVITKVPFWFPGPPPPFPNLQTLINTRYRPVYNDADVLIYKRLPVEAPAE